MNKDTHNDHLSADLIQALLDGEAPERDLGRAEEHLRTCARCSAEFEAWRVLFDDLGRLSTPSPSEHFAERVMSGLGSVGLEATDHLAHGALQDFVEGVLVGREAALAERHLARCESCTLDAASWSRVLDALGQLPTFDPAAGFDERVMSRIEIPVPLPLTARIRSRLAAFVGRRVEDHVPQGLLQDFVDGVLPARAMARIRDHVDACGDCARDAHAWSEVVDRIGTLHTFAPAADFGERVMAQVRVRQPVALRRPLAVRAMEAARRFIPQSREAWAALSGVAVTPAVISGLVVYAVFSHPTLTVGSLVSFAWWQVTDMALAGGASIFGAAVQSAEVFGLYALFEAFAQAPMWVAGGVLVYSMACVLALRVLYRNLNTNRPATGRYAHVSAS